MLFASFPRHLSGEPTLVWRVKRDTWIGLANFPPTFLLAAATWRTTTPFFELQPSSTSAIPSIFVPVANLRVGIFAKEGEISHTFIYIDHFTANFFASNHMFPPWLPSVIISICSGKKLETSPHSRNLLTLGPNVTYTSVYHDTDPQNSIDTLLARSGIDPIIVILPITKQPEVILKALAAGKHALSERPFAEDVATETGLVREYGP